MPVEATYAANADLRKDLSGTHKFMKYIIVGLAVLYLIFGCVLCAVGSYATTGASAELAGQTLPVGLIVIGSFLIVSSLIGVISALKEIRIGLLIFFVLMLIWSIILISIGIAVFAEKNNVDNLLASGWAKAPKDLKENLQTTFICCGRYGYNSVNPDDPENENCVTPCPGQNISTDPTTAPGCVPTLSSSLKSNLTTAGNCGIAFSVIMFVGLAFTCFLMRGIQSKNYAISLEKVRARTDRDREARRNRGKGGMKIPDTVL
jgi:FtsH-binding integral membrane protein